MVRTALYEAANVLLSRIMTSPGHYRRACTDRSRSDAFTRVSDHVEGLIGARAGAASRIAYTRASSGGGRPVPRPRQRREIERIAAPVHARRGLRRASP